MGRNIPKGELTVLEPTSNFLTPRPDSLTGSLQEKHPWPQLLFVNIPMTINTALEYLSQHL